MSVVCKVHETNGLYAYAKGSPEMMTTIMARESIPRDYSEVLK